MADDKDPSVEAQWARVRARLRKEVGETAYRSWIKPLTLLAVDRNEARLGATTRFVRDWVRSHYADLIRTAWATENRDIAVVDIAVQAATTIARSETLARPEPPRVPIPLQVGAPPSHVVRVATVSCGRSHSAFVCTVGELYTFGLGLYGQLGHRTLTAQTTPRRVDGLGGPVVSVSCGGLHTLLVRADGRALSCGFNESGRL